MERVGNIDVIFKDGTKSTGHPLYPGFEPGTTILTKGTTVKDGHLTLPCDILWERDTVIKLRDGTKLFADVYRPASSKEKRPAIIASAGFGKNGGINRYGMDSAPWRHGVPRHIVSSLEKFEGPDPAYWCLHGYAIVHPDIRGTWMSEGDTYINSTLDGKDGYDIVEWVAEQSWSNQRVTMAGNSYLSQTQWFVGAEKPPHLTCLAPWEGWNDLYNDTARQGGIPNPEFQQNLLDGCMPGQGRTEDVTAMTHKYPLWNDYWEDRRARCDKIEVPVYIVASWTNALHCRGTFRGWLETKVEEKWLRVHNNHEWQDFYRSENVEDLRKFYDHYMKNKSNGWEYTPRVRLSILNPGHKDIVNRPEQDFPLQRQVSRKLFLDAFTGQMSLDTAPQAESQVKCDARTGLLKFTHVFNTRTELTGFFKLRLWVEVIGHADLDLFAKFSKLNASGTLLETKCIDVTYLSDDPEKQIKELERLHVEGDKHINVFFAEGSTGRLRASHRELDEARSTPHRPAYSHRNLQNLEPGEVVPVEIELWPHGMIWEAGEQIRVTVSGFNTRPEIMWRTPPGELFNRGEMVLHTGGKFDSHLLIPFIP